MIIYVSAFRMKSFPSCLIRRLNLGNWAWLWTEARFHNRKRISQLTMLVSMVITSLSSLNASPVHPGNCICLLQDPVQMSFCEVSSSFPRQNWASLLHFPNIYGVPTSHYSALYAPAIMHTLESVGQAPLSSPAWGWVALCTYFHTCLNDA